MYRDFQCDESHIPRKNTTKKICFSCHKVGHLVRNCPMKKRTIATGIFQEVENKSIKPQHQRIGVIPSPFPWLQTWRFKCFSCKKEGHLVKNCPHKKVALVGDSQQRVNNIGRTQAIGDVFVSGAEVPSSGNLV